MLDRVRAACAYRVALVTAPAGFGKSVAIRQYLESAPISHVRFALRKENETLLGFVRGFAECIEPFAPMAVKSVAGAYERATQTSDPARELAIWLAALLRDVDGTIVIDDLHIASEDRAAELVAELIDRTLPNLRWILSTRDLSPLPIATWFAQNACGMPVDERDLELTLDEAKSAAAAAGVQLDAEAITELLSLTKSWPAAFAFALGVSKHTSDVRQVSLGTREMVYGYLADQVYGDLADVERRFLLQTCMLPMLDTAVLTAGGLTEAPSMLSRLRDQTAFVSQESETIFRYHDLFRDFLEHQVRGQGSLAFRECLLNGAKLLDRGGRPESALLLYLQAGEGDAIRRLLLAHGATLLEQGFMETVRSGLSLVATPGREIDPELTALKAAIYWKMGRYEEAIELYALASERSEGDVCASICLEYSRCLLNNFMVAEAQAALLRVAPKQIRSEMLRVEVLATLAASSAILHEADKALAYLEQALKLSVKSSSEGLEATVLRHAAFVRLEIGDLAEAKRLSLRTIEIADGLKMFALAARACTTLIAASEALADGSAYSAAERMVYYGELAGERRLVLIGLANQYNEFAERGDEAALNRLDEALQSFDMSSDPRTLETVPPARALQLGWVGDFERAYDILRRAPLQNQESTRRAHRAAEIALYAAAAGLRDEAEYWAGESESALSTGPAERRFLDLVARTRIYLALTFAILGKNALASSNLAVLSGRLQISARSRALVETTRQYCLSLSARDETPELGVMLSRLRSLHIEGLARLIEALPRPDRSHNPAFASLTKGELQILKLLSRGSTSRDIARELGRSPQTVDTHVKSILRKLGCGRRQQAVLVARSHGLV